MSSIKYRELYTLVYFIYQYMNKTCMSDNQKLKTYPGQDLDQNYIYRTIIIEPEKTASLSKLIRKLQVFQAHMYNKGIEYGLHEKYEHI